jgi:thiamine-phosphate pyrophosphorylase
MEKLKDISGLYAIIDDVVHADYGLERLLHDIVLKSSIPIIQIRSKTLEEVKLVSLIKKAIQLKSERDFILILNDHWSLVSKYSLSVDGVHLGQGDDDLKMVRESLPDHILLGLSTHSVEQAQKAFDLGASYIGCGAVFSTETKKRTVSLGVDGLRGIVKNFPDEPLVAIGGIHQSNIQEVAETGVPMVAIISALTHGNDFVGEEFHQLFLNCQRSVS